MHHIWHGHRQASLKYPHVHVYEESFEGKGCSSCGYGGLLKVGAATGAGALGAELPQFFMLRGRKNRKINCCKPAMILKVNKGNVKRVQAC